MEVRRLAPLVRGLTEDPSSLTSKASGGDGWSRIEHLLAMILDTLRAANWQRTGKKTNRPKPISPLARGGARRIGRTTRSPAEVAALLKRFGPPEEVSTDE